MAERRSKSEPPEWFAPFIAALTGLIVWLLIWNKPAILYLMNFLMLVKEFYFGE